MLLASTVVVLGLAGGELPVLPDLFGPEQVAVASVVAAPLPPALTDGWVLGIPLDTGGCSESGHAALDNSETVSDHDWAEAEGAPDWLLQSDTHSMALSDWRGLFALKAGEWGARS